MSLDRRIVSGVFWVGLSSMTSRALAFVARIILLRLLLPEDFGIMQTAFLALESLQLLREFGFSSALIYRKKDVVEASHVTFWVTNGTSVVYWALAFFGAPLVAAFFRDPRITPVVQVLSFVILIRAPGTVPMVLLAKEMDFRRRMLPDIVPTLAYGVVAVVLAIMGFGVWALVIAKLVEALFDLGVPYLVTSYRPALRFSLPVAREMFGYGMNIVLSQVLIFAITNIDDVFVGRIAGVAALGIYGTAYLLSNLPATNITGLVNQVMFPAFTKINEDIAYFRYTFFRTVHYVSLLTIPIAILTMVFAADFVEVLGPEKWGAAVIPIQLLAIYGLCRSIAANMGNVFKAGGKPQWLTYIAFWRLSMMLIFLYPVTVNWGVIGVSALSAIIAVIDWFISAWLTGKVIGGSLSSYARILLPLLLFAVLGAGAAYLLDQALFPQPSWLSLIVAGISAMSAYLGLVLVFDREVRRVAQQGLAMGWAILHDRRQVRNA